MTDTKKISILRDLITDAENKISSAKKILNELLGEESTDLNFLDARTKTLNDAQVDDGIVRVVEGVFDGQNMIDKKGKSYSIPANYASKSKLVVGDQLKLSITEDGKFLYKQIGPIERRSVIGPLTYENGQYKVLAEGKSYKILLASVTFYRAEIGDEISILLPEEGEAEWGALDVVLPREG